MDTKKLDTWADLLLDTGKRNNLINFKDTRATTVEVLLPSPDVLFEKVNGETSLEVFDPKIIEADDDMEDSAAPEQLRIESPDDTDTLTLNGKSAFLNQFSGKIKRQNQVLLYNVAGSPLTAVKNIDKKVREFIEETGVNVAYMAFGFIHWKESNSSSYIFHAPILLVPIQLVQLSAVEPYYVKTTEDDIIVNPTFSYRMDAEHGVKLPEYDDEGLTAYHLSKNARDRDRLRQEILERMGWKFYRIWSTDWFRNKSVEKIRLLEAAADAVRNPGKTEVKPVDNQPTETFEEVAVEKHSEFPAYKAADIQNLSSDISLMTSKE